MFHHFKGFVLHYFSAINECENFTKWWHIAQNLVRSAVINNC